MCVNGVQIAGSHLAFVVWSSIQEQGRVHLLLFCDERLGKVNLTPFLLGSSGSPGRKETDE